MKVSRIIEILQTNYNQNDSVVVAWWDKELFKQATNLRDEDWEAAADDIENIDWSNTFNALSDALDEWTNIESKHANDLYCHEWREGEAK